MYKLIKYHLPVGTGIISVSVCELISIEHQTKFSLVKSPFIVCFHDALCHPMKSPEKRHSASRLIVYINVSYFLFTRTRKKKKKNSVDMLASSTKLT